jgi:hypothetical protein
MEALEQEVFKYKKMAEREVDIIHLISYILYLLIGGTVESTTLILEVKNFRPSDSFIMRSYPLDESKACAGLPPSRESSAPRSLLNPIKST